MTNLLPCPGCGGEADPKEVSFTKPGSDDPNKMYHSPGCTKCGFTAPTIEVWNTRNYKLNVHKQKGQPDE